MSKVLNLPTRPNPMVNNTRDIIFEKKLGQGAFGQVFRISIRGTFGTYAVKMVQIIRSNFTDSIG
jgi:hypothetical protein